MKKRNPGFLSEELIDHNSEQFDYIVELHTYLWRFVWIYIPDASGYLHKNLDKAINIAEQNNLEDEKCKPI